MTIGALLGVELFRRDAKHVIALDADTMEHWLRMLSGLSLLLFVYLFLCRHEWILPRPSAIVQRRPESFAASKK